MNNRSEPGGQPLRRRSWEAIDALLLAGVASIVAGVAWLSKPAGLITFGLMCLGFVLLIVRGGIGSKPQRNNGNHS